MGLRVWTWLPMFQRKPFVQVMLIDPPGSSLFNKVKRGVLYTRHEAEGKRLKNPFDTITEGIGINRITANFSCAKVRHAPYMPAFMSSCKKSVCLSAH